MMKPQRYFSGNGHSFPTTPAICTSPKSSTMSRSGIGPAWPEYLVCGSTGEDVFLSAEEKCTLWEQVAKYAAPEKLLIFGTGMESVRETVCLTNRAAELGAHAALVRTPHYFKNQMTRMDTQMLFYRAVADQVKIPVLLYSFPQVTGVDLGRCRGSALRAPQHHRNQGQLRKCGTRHAQHIVREARPGFQVLVGSAHVLLPALMMGACGGILAYANAAPYSAIAIWEAFRTRRRRRRARLAKSHQPPGATLIGSKYRHPRPEARHGPEWLLRRAAPIAFERAYPAARQEIEEAFKDLKGVRRESPSEQLYAFLDAQQIRGPEEYTTP